MEPFFVTQVQEHVFAKTTERSFPGPAGILPVLTEKEMKRAMAEPSIKKRRKMIKLPSKSEELEKESNLLAANLKIATINRKPWKVLKNYLEENELLLLNSVSLISDVVQKVTKLDQKSRFITVPFMHVVLKKTATVRRLDQRTLQGHSECVCMDPSGSISVWFLSSAMRKMDWLIAAGSSLVLRNCKAIKFLNKPLLLVDENTILYRASDKENGQEADNENEDEIDEIEKVENDNQFPLKVHCTDDVVLRQYTQN